MEEELKVSARSSTNPLGNHKKNKGVMKPGVPDDDHVSSECEDGDSFDKNTETKIVQEMA